MTAALTLLLTLKDRAAFTARWLDYASRTGLPFRVLIADGGSDDRVERLLEDRARYPGLDCEYVRYPPDRSYGDYYAKLADALARVHTPYVAMADNDDFFVAASLQRSLDFLERNPGYVACGGQGAIFWIPPGEGASEEAFLGADDVAWKCTRETESVESPLAAERMRGQSVSSSDTSYYDVKRTAVARAQFETVRDLALADLFLVEILVALLTAVAGRTKRLDDLYLVRQHNAPGSSGGTHEQRHGDWLGRMLLPTWSRDFGVFCDAVAARLAEADGLSAEEARRSVIKAYRMMVAPSLLSNLLDEPTVTAVMPAVVSSVRRLVRLPPHSVLRRLGRFVYRRARWISLDSVYGTEIVSTPVPHAERDMEPILSFLSRQR